MKVRCKQRQGEQLPPLLHLVPLNMKHARKEPQKRNLEEELCMKSLLAYFYETIVYYAYVKVFILH